VPTPDSGARLSDTWAIVRGEPLFLRVAEPSADAPAILHLHGFAISGAYMTPTAELLTDDFRTYVPDLPGFGRSLPPSHPLTIPELADSAADVLDTLGVDRATVLGNSLGCAILASFAQRHPDRIERAIMVSPAGGIHNRPLLRAIGQLALDAPREPVSMATVAVPDYVHFGFVDALRLFVAMTRFPALEAVLSLDVPLLAVLGARDPLLPPWSRIRQVVAQLPHDTRVAVLRDAAHAINYSHPTELAAVVRQFMADEPVTGPTPGPGISPMVAFRGGALHA
jgi:pimeloyl-ACP methyl ester carboxylesterase